MWDEGPDKPLALKTFGEDFCPKGAGQEESFRYRCSLNDQERSHCQRQHSISYLHDDQDDNAVHSEQERRWRKEGGRGEIKVLF